MLILIKSVHATVYATMAAAILYTLYSGISGIFTAWTAISIGLVALEIVVFAGNGFHCPLTQWAQHYGAPKGYVGETFLSERASSILLRALAVLFVVGLAMLLVGVP